MTAALFCGIWFLSPLRRPDFGVRAWVLKKTPLGSSLAEVDSVVTTQGWFLYRSGASDDGNWSFSGTYIRGELGTYQGLPLQTSVTAFGEFDVNDKLKNVQIWKTRDGL